MGETGEFEEEGDGPCNLSRKTQQDTVRRPRILCWADGPVIGEIFGHNWLRS